MKKLVWIFFLLPVTAKAGGPAPVYNHCIFIGTNIGESQSQGKYIIAIGNFKEDAIFKDSSINIDRMFPYFHTRKGKKLLAFIENNYGKTTTKEFMEELQHTIKTSYLIDMEIYIRNRRYDKPFFYFN